MTDPALYRHLVGQLIYLTNTRPDISYSVQQLSQFIQKLTTTHFEAAFRVVPYIKSVSALGLFYLASSPLQIKAFCDSDWATCPDTRRSTTGYCIFIRGIPSCLGNPRDRLLFLNHQLKPNTVPWQPQSAKSSGSAFSGKISTWTSYLLLNYIVIANLPDTLQQTHPSMKEHELDCHIVREKLQQKLFHLLPISTKQQLADLLTKSLDPLPLSTYVSKLDLKDIYSAV